LEKDHGCLRSRYHPAYPEAHGGYAVGSEKCPDDADFPVTWAFLHFNYRTGICQVLPGVLSPSRQPSQRLNNMINIILKPSEYATAVYLTSVRDFVNRDFGVNDKQMGKDDGFQIGVDGLVAEIAVCKHFNVFPDLSFDPRSGGIDCMIKGKKVDVKSTKPGKERVYIPEWKKQNDIDIYIYCYVNFRNVQILGWFSPQYIFRDDNIEQSQREGIKHHVLFLKDLKKFKHDS
jgi:hypothetical protein